MGIIDRLRSDRDLRQLRRELKLVNRSKLKAAIRDDRMLHSAPYADGLLSRIGMISVWGVAGLLISHALMPDFTGLLLIPAAVAAAFSTQSFKLTYLSRHPKPLDNSRKELR